MSLVASVGFGLRTGSGRLLQADGPATAKARPPYTCRVGDVVRAVDFAQRSGEVSDRALNGEVLRCPTVQASMDQDHQSNSVLIMTIVTVSC